MTRLHVLTQYAEAKLYIDSADENVNFAIGLMNFGKEDIENAKATIKIRFFLHCSCFEKY